MMRLGNLQLKVFTNGFGAIAPRRGVVALVRRATNGSIEVLDARPAHNMSQESQRYLASRQLSIVEPGFIRGLAIMPVCDWDDACEIAHAISGKLGHDDGRVQE